MKESHSGVAAGTMRVFQTVLHTILIVCFYKNLHENFSAKGSNTPDDYRSKFAIRIENHQLIVDQLENLTVGSELDCMLKCMRKKECLSFDVSRPHGDQPDEWDCYLLSGDRYSHGSRLVASEGFDHYYFQNACSLFPSHLWKGHSRSGMPPLLWRITTTDQGQGFFNYSWTVDVSGGADGEPVILRGLVDSQFILHTPGLHPISGNVSFELAGHRNHYVVAENGAISVKIGQENEDFKRKATFSRLASPSHPGYETFMFQGQTVLVNPHSSYKLKCAVNPNTYGDITWFKLVN